MSLLLIGTFGSGNFASAENQKNKRGDITTQEYQNLLNLGFTDEEIEFMDQEELEQNKNLKGKVVGQDINYVKTTHGTETKVEKLDEKTYKEEVNKVKEKEKKTSDISAQLSKSTTTSYKTMTTSVVLLSGSTYRVKNSVTWDRMPMYSYVDVTGVGINEAYWGPLPGTEYGKQNWKTWSYCNGYLNGSATYTKDSTKWKRGSGGYSLKINLPDDETTGGCAADRVEELSSYMYYSVSPMTSTNRLDAYGQYAHQESNYTLTPSISLSGVEFSVSPSKEFSFHPNTHVLYWR
ncbi:hypothetical protein [Bacillus sp. ISL-39]|uniref:hypothetical protein n=1 Tax=Bacillus sp. ISL-39 TaxID=2819124 RepID=UPI001BEC86E8|nr:hypothetical protein [Bacillus sp. ISL-39]MBT2639860.1 hypothetical protein [Bacillus sp. ISL-39]